MSLPPRRAKARDANEPEIIEALEHEGYYVHRIDEPCDLAVQCVCGGWVLIEVKNPKGKTGTYDREGRTRKQAREASEMHVPIPIARSADEALSIVCNEHSCR